MKILIVLDDLKTSNNGTTISARRFTNELRRQGHEVRFLGLCPEGEPDAFPLEEYHLPLIDGLVRANDFIFVKSDKAVIRTAVQWADVVHCMMPFMLTYWTGIIATEEHKPMTAAFHIQPENLFSAVRLGKCAPIISACYAVWRHWIYSPFDYIHCPSQFMRQTLLDHHYNGNIRAISNGIDPVFREPRAPYKSPKYEGKIVLLMIGRLAREKRQDLIIKAIAKSKYKDQIQLVLAGLGPLKEDYQKLEKKVGLTNPIEFVYYSQDQLIDLLRQTDLYIHASDMESEAIACIEACAMGVVPVISDSTKAAPKQFALDDRSLFRAGNAKDLARKIDYWLDRPAQRAEMSPLYREMTKQYTLEASVKQFVKMLQDEMRTFSQKQAAKQIRERNKR